ncbi:hypothetical protein QAD02_007198 [Eretmocerus hayati]|uniref:Uncharacterized protein n=1 Tax=Eretmocerus hayati TaxID=131215 RepID=A0ACC2N3V3_9HYME|nr:hypothetical protein QAD02_007198 [Eretmocerus hayati]
MDQSWERKLTEFGLAQFIKRFQDSGVDQEVFLSLDEETLQNLFDPKTECGFLKKFKIRHGAFMGSQSSNDSQLASSCENDPPVIPGILDESKGGDTYQSRNEQRPQTPRLPLRDIGKLNQPSLAQADIPSPTSSSNLSTMSNLSTGSSQTIPNGAVRLTPQLLSVKELLRTRHEGTRVLNALEKGIIETRRICELVIDHEFDVNKPNHSMKQTRFLDINEQLVVSILPKTNKTADEIRAFSITVTGKQPKQVKPSLQVNVCMRITTITEEF